MEAKVNESAYKALKKLDESGDLLFELSALVEELIKVRAPSLSPEHLANLRSQLFVNTRYITAATTVSSLTQLYTDFPSSDPTVRLVLLLGVFINDHTPLSATPIRLKSKLEPLGLLPITRRDIFNVMINPFVEKYQSILEFARIEVGLSQKDIGVLAQEVSVRCLSEGCKVLSFLTLGAVVMLNRRSKGKMLRKLYESFPGVHDVIVSNALTRFRIDVDDLPSWEGDDSAGSYRAPLCRDYGCSFHALMAGSYTTEDDIEDLSVVVNVHEIDDVAMAEANGIGHSEEDPVTPSSSSGYVRSSWSDSMPELVCDEARVRSAELRPFPLKGRIGQDTLSAMIRQDETTTRSSRRRFYDVYASQGDLLGKLRYPLGESATSLPSPLILTTGNISGQIPHLLATGLRINLALAARSPQLS